MAASAVMIQDCAGWDDAIAHNFQLPGTKSSGPYQLAVQAAVAAKNLDTIEDAVASSGASRITMRWAACEAQHPQG